jgi:FkbM family methyltransferase
MTAVEAGANIGAHTLGLAHLVGPAGRVLAFEPQRPIFQVMCANMALNAITCVETHWAAVGSTPGSLAVPRLDLRMPGNFGGIELGPGRAAPPVPEEPVPVVTLDSFALPACHLIKIDVEGMEADVLRGAAETIARHRPVIYAENDRPKRAPELLGLLEALGYRAFWHLPPYVRVPNFRGNPQNEYPGLVSLNVLCIHRSAAIEVSGLAEAHPGGPWPI